MSTISKLKLDSFQGVKLVNFPSDIDLGIKSVSSDFDILIYFISELDDVEKFVSMCMDSHLPISNRVIMVYKKGKKDGVNRDMIFLPFKTGLFPNFKLKAPMLCSISDNLSAIIMSLELV